MTAIQAWLSNGGHLVALFFLLRALLYLTFGVIGVRMINARRALKGLPPLIKGNWFD